MKQVENIMAEVLSKSPSERFEIVAALLSDEQKRPEMVRLGWLLAKRTVDEHDFLTVTTRLSADCARKEKPQP